MDTVNHITKQKQLIARQEKLLAQEKLKKRRADTRRKIEFGGLVIKSAMDGYSKNIILGSLVYARRLIDEDEHYLKLFESIGNNQFIDK